MTELARSFDRAAEEYERGRPGYADAALDALGLPADSVVLDLAAGTGKLTRQLVPRFARVIAVEPLDGMRAQLERVVPGAEALVGTAESIPLDDDSVDAVFVAEAFHWFGTSAALDEIARVLRPGGTLAVLFNERDGELDPPLTQAFRDTLDELALKKPPEVTVSSGLGKRPFRGRSNRSKRSGSRTRSSATARACSHPSPRGAWSPPCPTTSAPCSSAGWRS